MKKRLFHIVFAVFCFQQGYAQTFRTDSTFSWDGILITDLTTNYQQYGTAIQVQPGGEVLACGHPIGTAAIKLAVARYLSDGQVDPAFNFTGLLNFQGYGTVMGLQEDGKILCGFRTGLIRFLANGMIDNTFGTNGFVSHIPNFDVTAIVNLPNQKIGVLGHRNDDPTLGYVFRVYHSNGTLDTSFSDDGKLTYKYGDGVGYIMKALAQTDGKILVAGDYSHPLFEVKFTIFRLTPAGEFDPNFGVDGFITDVVDGYNQVFGMATQPDGKIVVTGFMNLPPKLIALRYLPNGTRDSTFGIDGLQVLEAEHGQQGMDMLIREDGKILILKQVITPESKVLLAFTQLLADGSIDSTFGNNGLFTSSILSSGFGPCTMFLTGSNKVIVGANGGIDTNPLIIARFLLDLNVGILGPDTDFQQHSFVYPNPVEEHFTLKFTLNAPESVGFDLYDMSGKLVTRLGQGRQFDAGEHSESFQLNQGIPAGNYALVLSIEGNPVSSIQIMKK